MFHWTSDWCSIEHPILTFFGVSKKSKKSGILKISFFFQNPECVFEIQKQDLIVRIIAHNVPSKTNLNTCSPLVFASHIEIKQLKMCQLDVNSTKVKIIFFRNKYLIFFDRSFDVYHRKGVRQSWIFFEKKGKLLLLETWCVADV